jgi:osmotically inducible protein OsmC
MATTGKVLFTGNTHTTGGRDGASRSKDGFVDIKLPQPHPAAENLFATAWSACFIGAIEVAAAQKKIKLPSTPAVDAQIDLNIADGAYFLRARLDVSVPGVDRQTAQTLVDMAHGICPYSKATRGNIEVSLNVL